MEDRRYIPWYLRADVNVLVILALLGNIGGGIWWASALSSKAEDNRLKNIAQDVEIHDIRSFQDARTQALGDQLSEIKSRLANLEGAYNAQYSILRDINGNLHKLGR